MCRTSLVIHCHCNIWAFLFDSVLPLIFIYEAALVSSYICPVNVSNVNLSFFPFCNFFTSCNNFCVFLVFLSRWCNVDMFVSIWEKIDFCCHPSVPVACTSQSNTFLRASLMQWPVSMISHYYFWSFFCHWQVRNVTVDGGFGAWTGWSTCSHNDGGSAGSCLCRTRACNNPAPQCGGQQCYGISVEVANCSR